MHKTANSEEKMMDIGAQIAKNLTCGDVVLLHGTLGMGKTVLSRGIIRALTPNENMEVPSPTFTIVQNYDGANCPIYHYDLYRIEHEDEILELGWEGALADGITIVEWPDRLGTFKPAKTIDITINPADNNPESREIKIEGISL